MKDRIKKVMDETGLSASKFADKIGVPRSGLSHVLSGRNKPSLDYVIKLLNAFPNMDPNWLIMGEKSLTFQQEKLTDNEFKSEADLHSNFSNSIASVNRKMEVQADKMIGEIKNVPKEEKDSIPVARKNSDLRLVERVVYFYKDGSFKEYFPQ